MLARFGPALPGAFVFLMPAEVLAVDHRELNASPDDFAPPAAGLVPLLKEEGVEDGLEMPGCVEPGDWIWTDV